MIIRSAVDQPVARDESHKFVSGADTIGHAFQPEVNVLARLGGLVLLLCGSAACATVYPPEQVDKLLGQAVTSADAALRLERQVLAPALDQLGQWNSSSMTRIARGRERMKSSCAIRCMAA